VLHSQPIVLCVKTDLQARDWCPQSNDTKSYQWYDENLFCLINLQLAKELHALVVSYKLSAVSLYVMILMKVLVFSNFIHLLDGKCF